MLVGGNPFDTTSIYGLIHYLESAYGVFFAMGGTGAITRALTALMQRHSLGLFDEADCIERSVDGALSAHAFTADLASSGRGTSTDEAARAA